MWKKKDLKRLSILYNKNWSKLTANIDTNKLGHYVARENKLEKLCVDIQTKLGVRLKNPCPLLSPKRCEVCDRDCDHKTSTLDIFGYITASEYIEKSKILLDDI